MIYLPERHRHGWRLDAAATITSSLPHIWRAVTSSAPFALKLADLPGFDDRAETGLEALDGFVASFEDPAFGGALLRLCEVDAHRR